MTTLTVHQGNVPVGTIEVPASVMRSSEDAQVQAYIHANRETINYFDDVAPRVTPDA